MPEEGLKQRLMKRMEAYIFVKRDVLTELDKTIAEMREWDCYCRKCNGVAPKPKCFKEHPEWIIIYWTDVKEALDSNEGKKWHLSRSTPKVADKRRPGE